jgi:hypothetical protein
MSGHARPVTWWDLLGLLGTTLAIVFLVIHTLSSADRRPSFLASSLSSSSSSSRIDQELGQASASATNSEVNKQQQQSSDSTIPVILTLPHFVPINNATRAGIANSTHAIISNWQRYREFQGYNRSLPRNNLSLQGQFNGVLSFIFHFIWFVAPSIVKHSQPDLPSHFPPPYTFAGSQHSNPQQDKTDDDKPLDSILPPSTCIGWRQTGGCVATGPRETKYDKECSILIDSSASGYCECEAGRVNASCKHVLTR